VALDGLCRPCADAEFYGTRKRHEGCERGAWHVDMISGEWVCSRCQRAARKASQR
jgi:hypothetical protein